MVDRCRDEIGSLWWVVVSRAFGTPSQPLPPHAAGEAVDDDAERS
jgi:hypothetical protein